MKKIVLIIFLLLIFSQTAFAEYRPIPENMQVQYKTEVEQYLDKKIPIIKKEIEQKTKIFKITYKNCNKQKVSNSNCIKILEEYTYYLDTVEFYFYLDLINITKNYVNIENEIPHTDFSYFLYEFIAPYVKNIKAFNNFIKYIDKKQIQSIIKN